MQSLFIIYMHPAIHHNHPCPSCMAQNDVVTGGGSLYKRALKRKSTKRTQKRIREKIELSRLYISGTNQVLSRHAPMPVGKKNRKEIMFKMGRASRVPGPDSVGAVDDQRDAGVWGLGGEPTGDRQLTPPPAVQTTCKTAPHPGIYETKVPKSAHPKTTLLRPQTALLERAQINTQHLRVRNHSPNWGAGGEGVYVCSMRVLVRR